MLHERQRGLSRELVVLRKTTKCGEGRSRQQRLILTLGPRPSASPSTVCYELPVAEGLSESLVQDDRIAHSASYGRSSTSRRLACGAVMHFPNEHNRLRIRPAAPSVFSTFRSCCVVDRLGREESISTSADLRKMSSIASTSAKARCAAWKGEVAHRQ